MKTCGVPSCRKNSSHNPDIVFFNLPRDPCAKGEWLDALGLKHRYVNQNLKVCEIHFRSKDFCVGRRQLKGHAVPALNLGAVKSEPVTSDDFMHCDSDNDDEILAEVKKFSSFDVVMDRKASKEEIGKSEEVQEPETGRRPSRRAAREAAKKIYNTVRNYGCNPDVDDSDVVSSKSSTKSERSPRAAQRQRQKASQKIHVPPPNIDLLLECHEELLSTVQAEALLQAQLQYNMVMKTLRSLKASNVRIIVAPADPVVSESSNDAISDPKQPEEGRKTINSTDTTAKIDNVSKNGNGIVFPMELSTNVPSPAPILS